MENLIFWGSQTWRWDRYTFWHQGLLFFSMKLASTKVNFAILSLWGSVFVSHLRTCLVCVGIPSGSLWTASGQLSGVLSSVLRPRGGLKARGRSWEQAHRKIWAQWKNCRSCILLWWSGVWKSVLLVTTCLLWFGVRVCEGQGFWHFRALDFWVFVICLAVSEVSWVWTTNLTFCQAWS